MASRRNTFKASNSSWGYSTKRFAVNGRPKGYSLLYSDSEEEEELALELERQMLNSDDTEAPELGRPLQVVDFSENVKVIYSKHRPSSSNEVPPDGLRSQKSRHSSRDDRTPSPEGLLTNDRFLNDTRSGGKPVSVHEEPLQMVLAPELSHLQGIVKSMASYLFRRLVQSTDLIPRFRDNQTTSQLENDGFLQSSVFHSYSDGEAASVGYDRIGLNATSLSSHSSAPNSAPTTPGSRSLAVDDLELLIASQMSHGRARRNAERGKIRIGKPPIEGQATKKSTVRRIVPIKNVNIFKQPPIDLVSVFFCIGCF
jgi:hypothetical protein